MKPEIKKAWLEALRSGNYKQGEVRLKQTFNGVYKHCCLGVLCEVLPQFVDGVRFENNGGQMPDFISTVHYQSVTSTTFLPRSLLAKIGLAADTQVTLSLMNDEGGKTFDEIADYIEEKL